MHLQPALRQTTFDVRQDLLRLRLRPTVRDDIIRVPLEGNVRVRGPHPVVEREVQEDIGQERARDAPLGRPRRARHQGSVVLLHRSGQPPLHIEQNPPAPRVLPDRSHDERVVEVVEEAADVQIDHPVVTPASLPGCRECVDRRLPRAIPIRIGVELRLHFRFQVHLDHRLGNSVGDSGYAQAALASVLFRYTDRPDRRREVRARRHPIPNPIEIVLQVLLEHLDRLSIHASCSVVRLDPSVSLPNHPLGNTKRLRVARRLLPRARLTVGIRWMTRPLCSIEFPRLHRSYGSLRPCASHRASHPWGSAPWISPFTSRRQVPTFRTRAWCRVTPPLCRVPTSQAAGSRWTRPGLALPDPGPSPVIAERRDRESDREVLPAAPGGRISPVPGGH